MLFRSDPVLVLGFSKQTTHHSQKKPNSRCCWKLPTIYPEFEVLRANGIELAMKCIRPVVAPVCFVNVTCGVDIVCAVWLFSLSLDAQGGGQRKLRFI